jgi:hypothetical protein
MNVHTSIGMPVFCATSTIGAMSWRSVRAAQFAGDVRARPREPDVGGVDAERVDQVEDPHLVFDRGGADGGRLQPVAQRLVVELDAERRPLPALAGVVPVVDEVGGFHWEGRFRGVDGVWPQGVGPISKSPRRPSRQAQSSAAARRHGRPWRASSFRTCIRRLGHGT